MVNAHSGRNGRSKMFGYIYIRRGDQHIIKTEHGTFPGSTKQTAIDRAELAAHRARLEKKREQQRRVLLSRRDRRVIP